MPFAAFDMYGLFAGNAPTDPGAIPSCQLKHMNVRQEKFGRESWIMQKWTYYLTVVNELDRPLELISENLAWGRKEKDRDNFPRIINPGTSAEYRVFSPAGTSTGIEFYLSFRDKAPAGEHSYGTVKVEVDMPYWKHRNTSSCRTTGTLTQNGFTQVPNGVHDFSTSFVVSNLPK